MKTTKLSLLIALFLALSAKTFAQSSSPNYSPPTPEQIRSATSEENVNRSSSTVITFDDFPLNTPITNQYANIGIIFSGNTFITLDGANPTSPVLSGTPRFQGSISGTFVRPGTQEPTIVESFMFDAGFFDEFGSTRIEWFDPNGEKLGQRINSTLGIETFTISGGNISSWRISIVANEPAGFAIDNVSFVAAGPSILFREKSGDDKDGTWGFFVDEIPGFDHVGFHLANVVYESHPGYGTGIYTDASQQESRLITSENGVQNQHSRGTFEHDAPVGFASPVIDFVEIPIDSQLAVDMEVEIQSVSSDTFQGIDYNSLAGIQATLTPSIQKGGNSSFTCVGLIEWAAEQANHNGGQGFIRNDFETVAGLPTLSPQLMYYSLRAANLINNSIQWVQGILDPVDFMITDPLGRRLGYIEGIGELNEIPGAFYTGDGGVEQFLIPTAIPGAYSIQYVGLGDSARAGIASPNASANLAAFLETGETVQSSLLVSVVPGGAGDVNGDGTVDNADVIALSAQLNTFTNGLDAPGDLDRDGLLSTNDVALLNQLIG
ncbi:MAG: dockerin type I domain-containing protein, partial [Bacteroidota bacterium]